ncbi:MAG: HYR domain-containing protein [Planctomycetes bacterium]|nr:HYR domain-containing protein [Planctomycetota bacterium]
MKVKSIKLQVLMACAIVTQISVASASLPNPMFFSSRGNTIYRFNLTDPPETFVMSDRFAAMSTDSSGTIWLIGRLDVDNDGFLEIYTLDDPCGIPSLVLQGDFIADQVAAMTFINGNMYIVQAVPQAVSQRLAIVDVVNQTVTPVGVTGIMQDRAESTGFDFSTNTLYGIDNGTDPVMPVLKTINWNPLPGEEPLTSAIGPTGQYSATCGGEFFGGIYYHLISVWGGGGFDYILGTVDISTGQFSAVRTVDTGTPNGVIGLAILNVPEGTSCPVAGACCFQGEGCSILSEAACANLEGLYLGDDSNCEADADGDGVTDCFDNCPETPAETPVDENGCSCVQIGDETDPVIENCPQDFEAGAEGCTAVLGDFTSNLSVSDNCDSPEDLQITQLPLPGTELPEGPTVVTLTVTDTSGNSASCITITQSPPANTPVGVGETLITFTVTDAAENEATCTATLTVTAEECQCGDNTPPVIEQCSEGATLQANAECFAEVPDLTGDVIASDTCTSPATTQPSDENNNNNNNNGDTLGVAGLVITQDPPAGTIIGIGQTVVVITVTDPSNNSATCEATITVLQGECVTCGKGPDETPPTIGVCPEDDSIDAGAGCMAELGDYTDQLEVSDNCSEGEGITVSQDPAPGTQLAVGVHTVTLTAEDQAGNVNSCTFSVTVNENNCNCGDNDNENPTITTCAASQTLLADQNCDAIVPDLTGEVEATDNCSSGTGLTVTQSPTAGTVIEVGDTVVTLTVTDEAGNSADCTATLTVDANGCDPTDNPNNNNNNNGNSNNNVNNNNSGEPPVDQPVPCDQTADDSVNILFSLLFHAPVCGPGCPLLGLATLCGFLAMKTGRRRRK